MADKKEFIKFLEKFEIPYHTKGHNYSRYYNGYDRFEEDDEENKENNIVLLADDEKKSDKIGGYNGFHCTIEFDKNDKFIKFGIWE